MSEVLHRIHMGVMSNDALRLATYGWFGEVVEEVYREIISIAAYLRRIVSLEVEL